MCAMARIVSRHFVWRIRLGPNTMMCLHSVVKHIKEKSENGSGAADSMKRSVVSGREKRIQRTCTSGGEGRLVM